jgi:ketopantoate reductase
MRIAIIGSGAVGGVFANKLQSAGHEVNFFSKRNDAYIECLIYCNGKIRYESIINIRNIDFDRVFDIVIIAVKIYDLQNSIYEYQKILNNSSYILPVQSYINFQKIDWGINLDKVFPVAIMFGAFGKPTSLITYFNDGFICIGKLKKSSIAFPFINELKAVCQVLETEDIQFQLFIKVLINASMVSFCIESLGSFSKALDTNIKVRNASIIFEEGINLAKVIYPKNSVILPNNRLLSQIKSTDNSMEIITRVIFKYPDVIPSIVFDVIRKKETELKYIYDDIIDLGKQNLHDMCKLENVKNELVAKYQLH